MKGAEFLKIKKRQIYKWLQLILRNCKDGELSHQNDVLMCPWGDDGGFVQWQHEVPVEDEKMSKAQGI